MGERAKGSTNGDSSPREPVMTLPETTDTYAKIAGSSPLAISVTEAKSGIVLEINSAFERTFKARRDHVVGGTMQRFWHNPEDRERMLQVLAKQSYLRDYEVLACTYAREPITVLLNSDVIHIGGTECLVSFAQDITEQRKLEQARLESEERFAKAFQAAPYGVSLVELETDTYLDVNHGFERLFGCRKEHVIGMPVTDLPFWDREDRARYLAMMRRAGSVRELPARGRSMDGTRLRVLATGTTLEIAGRPCLLTFARDVTEQFEAERARAELEEQLREAQKLEALGTLAGGIAHDFNNILSAIVAYAHLIHLDRHHPQAVSEHVAELEVASGRARDLVQQILTFSRRQPHERKPVSLGVVLREATKLLRSTLPATVQIESLIAADTPIVMADLSQIHQIVLNLATNAAHAIARVPGASRFGWSASRSAIWRRGRGRICGRA
jgi:PAS domain S-box-containing protein